MKKYDNILLSTRKYKQKRDYWIDNLQDLEMGRLIQGNGRRDSELDGDALKKGVLEYKLAPELNEKLIKLAKNSDLTLFIFLLSSFIIFLEKYTGKPDIFLAIPVYRPDESENVFNDLVVIRKSVRGYATCRDLIMSVKEMFVKVCENHDYPFEKIIEELSFINETGYDLLYDIIFASENIHSLKYRDRKENHLSISYSRINGDIRFRCHFSEFFYCLGEIENIMKYFSRALGIISANITAPLSVIELLSAEERKRILQDFNDTACEYPQVPVHILFREQVEKTPEQVALVHEDNQISYLMLEGNANRLAVELRDKRVTNDTIVGIMADRSIELLVGILGVLKAGGAYLPLDPEYKSRFDFILKDSGISLLLTTTGLADLVNFEKSVMFLDEERYQGRGENLENINRLEDLIYIIYTSGTTGKPKGVMIEHRGAVNYLWWAAKTYIKNNEKVTFPLYTSVSFDFTVTSIFIPLITGNRIIIYDGKKKDFLIDRIVEKNMSEFVKLTPSHLRFLKYQKIENSIVKRFVLGGENLGVGLCRDIYENFEGKIEIYNEYGPTETVVGCMIYRFDPEKDKGKSVPIGIPSDNVRIFLLDREFKPVLMGVEGEMYIAGDGVGRGYLNRVELTGEKFIPDLFLPGKRMYRTGDRAKMLPDGNLEFLGRFDHQVSINGYRIELGEIEKQISTHEQVKEAIVIKREDREDEEYLCAYIVLKENFNIQDLRTFLGNKLPSYMIPAYYVDIEKIPLTPNGKLNTKALPKPKPAAGSGVEYVSPTSDQEVVIAGIWKEVLNLGEVGINDNFFDLGGTSMDIIRVNHKVQEKFKKNIPIVMMYKYTTVASFSNFLESGMAEDNAPLRDRSDVITKGKADRSKRRDLRKRRSI